jgi:hypothetical protein
MLAGTSATMVTGQLAGIGTTRILIPLDVVFWANVVGRMVATALMSGIQIIVKNECHVSGASCSLIGIIIIIY